MIEILLKTYGNTTTSPVIKAILSDNDKFIDCLELEALIDTGADISFINEKHFQKFNFYSKPERRDNKEHTLYRACMRIDGLTSFHSQFFGRRNNINTNPDENEPDILLGRDFLKHVRLVYDGPNNHIQIEWIKS
jgi:hypothetical protein